MSKTSIIALVVLLLVLAIAATVIFLPSSTPPKGMCGNYNPPHEGKNSNFLTVEDAKELHQALPEEYLSLPEDLPAEAEIITYEFGPEHQIEKWIAAYSCGKEGWQQVWP